LKTFTFTDIQIRDPNYDIGEYLPENWSGTALDILRYEEMPAELQLWIVLRPESLDDKTLRLFAVWCARQVQHLLTDPRRVAALDVAERFANGQAPETELREAQAEATPKPVPKGANDAAWGATVAVEVALWVQEAYSKQAAWAADRAAEIAAVSAGAAEMTEELEGWAHVAPWAAEAVADAEAAVAFAGKDAREQSRNAQVAQLIKMLEEKNDK